MNFNKQISIAGLSAMIFLVTGCGDNAYIDRGGEAQTFVSMHIIENYANDNSNPAPTVETYTTAGVSGVNAENIEQVNSIVDAFIGVDVDTPEEVQHIADLVNGKKGALEAFLPKQISKIPTDIIATLHPAVFDALSDTQAKAITADQAKVMTTLQVSSLLESGSNLSDEAADAFIRTYTRNKTTCRVYKLIKTGANSFGILGDMTVDGTFDRLYTYTLDKNGFAIRVDTDYNNDGTVDEVKKQTVDSKGNPIIREYDLDNDGSIEKKIISTYDDHGNVLKSIFSRVNEDPYYTVTRTYDTNDNKLTEDVDYWGDGTKTDKHIEYVYDSDQKLIQTKYDLNNDGTFERIDTIQTDSNGNIIDRLIDYDADGTPDRHYARTYSPHSCLLEKSEVDYTNNGSLDMASIYSYDMYAHKSKLQYDYGNNGSIERAELYEMDPSSNNRPLKYSYDYNNDNTIDRVVIYESNAFDMATKRMYDYDVDGKIDQVVTIKNDALGHNIEEVTDYNNDGIIDSKISREYDTHNMQTLTSYDDNADGTPDRISHYLERNAAGQYTKQDLYQDGKLIKLFHIGYDPRTRHRTWFAEDLRADGIADRNTSYTYYEDNDHVNEYFYDYDMDGKTDRVRQYFYDRANTSVPSGYKYDATNDGIFEQTVSYERDNNLRISKMIYKDQDGNNTKIVYQTYTKYGHADVYSYDNDADGNVDSITTYKYRTDQNLFTAFYYDTDADGTTDKIYHFTEWNNHNTYTKLSLDLDADGDNDRIYIYTFNEWNIRIKSETDSDADGTVDNVTTYTEFDHNNRYRDYNYDSDNDGVIDRIYHYMWSKYGTRIAYGLDTDTQTNTDLNLMYVYGEQTCDLKKYHDTIFGIQNLPKIQFVQNNGTLILTKEALSAAANGSDPYELDIKQSSGKTGNKVIAAGAIKTGNTDASKGTEYKFDSDTITFWVTNDIVVEIN